MFPNVSCIAYISGSFTKVLRAARAAALGEGGAYATTDSNDGGLEDAIKRCAK